MDEGPAGKFFGELATLALNEKKNILDSETRDFQLTNRFTH